MFAHHFYIKAKAIENPDDYLSKNWPYS